MARGRSAFPVEVYSFPAPDTAAGSLESDSEPDDTLTKSSLLYALLPRLVKSRIRRLPSLRRSVTGYGKVYEVHASATNSSRASSTGMDGGTRSPPPEYQSSVSLPEPLSDVEERDVYEVPETASAYSPSKRLRTVPRDNGSGIRWKFANQGLSLIGLSAQESSTPPQDPSTGGGSSSSLARQLYIHGLTYILRGMPADLSADEKISVWTAIPDSVHELSAGSGDAQELLVIQGAGASSSSSDGPSAQASPSVLHRLLAALIVQACLIANFLLPYVRLLAATLYRYERQHRVSERVFASSVSTVDWSVKKGVEISESVCRINDGKVGRAINDLAVWWIRGVTGGIHQGVGEGLVVMGIDDWDKRSGKAKAKKGR